MDASAPTGGWCSQEQAAFQAPNTPMILDLLKLREFRAFLVANTIESMAQAAMTVLLGLQIYEIRHNTLDLAWLGLVEALPGVTLVLYGGHVADQHSRRRIVLITTAALTVLSAVLAFASEGRSTAPIATLLVVAFLTACAKAFETPAASGLEAQVLPTDKVLRGVPVLASAARTAQVIGPAFGGLLWAWIGPSGTYAVLAVMFALTCLLLLTQVSEKPPTYRGDDGQTLVQRIREGIVFVFRDQVLVGSMALDLFAVFFGGATALLPVVALDILHTDESGVGLLRSASSAGALLAAMLATRFLPKRRAGAALHSVIAGFGVCMVVFGLSQSFVLSLLAMFAAGAFDGLSMVIRHAIMRLASPNELRGRISAVRMVFVGSSNEIGAFESGLAAKFLGTGPAIWGGGVITILVVAAVAALAPKLRALDLEKLAASGPNARAAVAEEDVVAAIDAGPTPPLDSAAVPSAARG